MTGIIPESLPAMTVPSEQSRIQYTTDGTSVSFPVPFRFLNAAHLQVARQHDDESSILDLGVDYSVSGVGNQAGGTITTTTPLPAGDTISIERVVPITQETAYQRNDPFPERAHEQALDKLTMICQMLGGILGLTPGSINRALLLGAADIDGKGSYRANGNRISNLGAPKLTTDAIRKQDLIEAISGLSVDGSGKYVVERLADTESSDNGASMVAFRDRMLSEYLSQQEYYLTIEHFGPTDTPQNTFNTIQTAINFCAQNGVLLRAKRREYIVNYSADSHMIPDNFRCDLGGAVIKRATGNKTPHDMWRNVDFENGNTGLSIKNVSFDGKRQDDDLTNVQPTQRFCGLRLVKVDDYELENIGAFNTVNGEFQSEGLRGGICLDHCTNSRVKWLLAYGTMGTGVMFHNGSGSLYGLATGNNTGSGLSGIQAGWNLENLSSDVSGYSGISINGPRVFVKNVRVKGSPLGFAGFGIGHIPTHTPGTEAHDTVVENVYVDSPRGWGITVTGSNRVKGKNWKVDGGHVSQNNLVIRDCPAVHIDGYTGRDVGGSVDIRVRGDVNPCDVFLDSLDVSVFEGNRICLSTEGSTRKRVFVGPKSRLTNGANTSGVVVTNGLGHFAKVAGLVNGTEFGVRAVGGSKILLENATLNATGEFWTVDASSKVFFRNTNRVLDSEMSGGFEIKTGQTVVFVSNSNVFSIENIVIQFLNASAKQRGLPVVTEATKGAGFTVSLVEPAAADATYRYVIM